MAVVIEQSGFVGIPGALGGASIDIPMLASSSFTLLVATLEFFHTTAGAPANPITGLTYKSLAGVKRSSATDAGIVRELWEVAGNFDGTSGNATFAIDPLYDGSLCVLAVGLAISGSFGTVSNITLAAGSSTTPSVTVIGTAATSLVIDFLAVNHGVAAYTTRTVGAGQTMIRNVQVQGNGDLMTRISNSVSREPGGGNVVMSWTLGISNAWGMTGFEIGIALTKPRQDLAVDAAGPERETTHIGNLAAAVGVDGPRRLTVRIVATQALAIETKLELVATQIVAKLTPAVLDAPIGAKLTARLKPRENLATAVGFRTATRIVPRVDLAVRTVQEGVMP